MKLSSVFELAGFAALSLAAYRWNELVGVAVAGVFLLVIGYSFDDDQAAISVARVIEPLKDWRTKRKTARRLKKIIK